MVCGQHWKYANLGFCEIVMLLSKIIKKIIKHYIYEDKSNMPTPRFIQKQTDYLETRLLEYSESTASRLLDRKIQGN